jgi:hypothetical protein
LHFRHLLIFGQRGRLELAVDPFLGRVDLLSLAAPIHRERYFSEILVRGDFGCGSSFGFFTA